MPVKTDYRWYVSLEKVKRQLGITGTAEDDRLKDWIEVASDFIENRTDRVFVPVTDTRYFDVPKVSGQNLTLHDDLLAVTEMSDDNGEILPADYFLYPLNVDPKLEVQLLRSSAFWYFSDTRQKAISIEGTWGYCDDYEDTGVTLDGAVAKATDTQVQVSEGAGIETGWCLLVETEQMFVRSKEGNVLRVRRGANGTTAATYDAPPPTVTVYRYCPPKDVEGVCIFLVSFWYSIREQLGVQSEKLGDYLVTYDGKPIPEQALIDLEHYERLTYPSPQETYP